MRWVMLVATVSLAACDGSSAFGLHPRVAASAAGQDLTVERLARWIAAVKRARPRSTHFEAVAALYVDEMLFAIAAADGRNFGDSALVLAARWPTVAQFRWSRFREAYTRARGPYAPAQVDSAFQAGGVRLMQHVLLRLTADAPADTVANTEARAAALRRRLTQGANFAAIARRYSEDPISRPGGGYLAVGSREEFLSPFNAVAWSLAPGEISGVVRSPFGVHIIRRPPLAEVRAAYAAGLARLAAAHDDSAHLRDLLVAKHVVFEADAPQLVRQMLGDLAAAGNDPRWVVRYDGGGLRVEDMLRWVLAVNPAEVALLPTASDAQVRQFLVVVTQRELVLAEADSARIDLTPAEWQTLRVAHDSVIGLLEDAFRVTPDSLGASTSGRRAVAAAHVFAHLDQMFGNEVPFVVVPPFLASVLRDSASWSINRRGIAAAVTRADRLLGAPSAP